MPEMEQGAFQALINCLSLKGGEQIMIITDVQSLEIGVAFLTESKKITPNVRFFILEDFGQRPLKSVPDEIVHAIHESDVGVFAATGVEGELQSFRRPLLKETAKAKIRFANMVNISQQIMEQGMRSDFSRIIRFSERLYDVLQRSMQIQVRTDAGTDLIAEFSSDMRWVNSNGVITEDHWSNLPGGEIFTCPANVNGKVVIDGVLGDYFASKYGLLDRSPVTVEIKDGRAVTVHCKNQKLQEDLRNYLGHDANANRVGEFALGTNLELKQLIGNMLQDEKMPGVHIAFGHGYPEKTGCPWKSEVHVDAVMKQPTVIVDNNIIMEKGVYRI